MRLTGRTAIVTGGSRGLGRAISVALAAEGASVIVAARTVRRGDDTLQGSLEDTVQEIRDNGGTARAVSCDVQADADLVALVEAAVGSGPLSIVVNNAAWTVPGKPGKRPAPLAPGAASAAAPALEMPVWAAQKQFGVNLFAPWRLIQLAVPQMASSGGGSVINVSSEAARMAHAPPAYGASKLALEFLTRAIAPELAAVSISVHALVPSLPVDTPGLAWVGGAPGDHQTPEDFAEAVVRLALPEAAPTTGSIVYSADVLNPTDPPKGWQGRDLT